MHLPIPASNDGAVLDDVLVLVPDDELGLDVVLDLEKVLHLCRCSVPPRCPRP